MCALSSQFFAARNEFLPVENKNAAPPLPPPPLAASAQNLLLD
jgi:hypothetical protein